MNLQPRIVPCVSMFCARLRQFHFSYSATPESSQGSSTKKEGDRKQRHRCTTSKNHSPDRGGGAPSRCGGLLRRRYPAGCICRPPPLRCWQLVGPAQRVFSEHGIAILACRRGSLRYRNSDASVRCSKLHDLDCGRNFTVILLTPTFSAHQGTHT